MPINKARAKRLCTSGNVLKDGQGRLWNVLEVDTSVKNQGVHYQLMQLTDRKGNRRFDTLIQGRPARTANKAKNNLIRHVFNDEFEHVDYDGVQNRIRGVIE